MRHRHLMRQAGFAGLIVYPPVLLANIYAGWQSGRYWLLIPMTVLFGAGIALSYVFVRITREN